MQEHGTYKQNTDQSVRTVPTNRSDNAMSMEDIFGYWPCLPGLCRPNHPHHFMESYLSMASSQECSYEKYKCPPGLQQWLPEPTASLRCVFNILSQSPLRCPLDTCAAGHDSRVSTNKHTWPFGVLSVTTEGAFGLGHCAALTLSQWVFQNSLSLVWSAAATHRLH